MEHTEELSCLDSRDGTRPEDRCEGPVEYREALSSTGKRFARCGRHWQIRLAESRRIRRDYPDSDTPPAWFDPAAAGEHWNDDY